MAQRITRDDLCVASFIVQQCHVVYLDGVHSLHPAVLPGVFPRSPLGGSYSYRHMWSANIGWNADTLIGCRPSATFLAAQHRYMGIAATRPAMRTIGA
ncbi:MAG: hypothetical protein WAO08_34360, partial [Hyphomicrobiaceae bacterium]